MNKIIHQMSFAELNEREKSILRYIIQQFILTASPVGSRNITKRYDLGISPATVRNIMSDLEESGFIDHPHTSAGRIPTDKGYRFYVDSLMNVQAIDNNEKKMIDKEFESKLDETDELLKVTSNILSKITRQLACVTYPKLETGALEKLQIISLSSTRILVVMSIKGGLVKTITIEFASEIKEFQISAVQNLLNERLSGLSFKEIRATFSERFKDVHEDQKAIIRLFLNSADKVFKDVRSSDGVYITGAKNVIQQPEFDDPERFQSVIELIEDKDIIVHILDKTEDMNSDNVYISIGKENEDQKLLDYSLITKEYKIGDVSGHLGIIGPKRMEYSKVIAIVDYVAKMLTETLKNEIMK
ncbi:MAG: heat-inducible transcription repressor HrcA [Ignavibacteria bacterium RIFOXYB2_FULL_35_12]|nr:MAG: heat-inducible transcription repressor HrcA [Ignavibacteria bacterium GWA2_36_19]OGU61708.1 MAG: heat-inducible transcription repressor HrcA [Ignavibacteria bacterium GWF2_35_20]OGU81584.1 MAG: heat-inducible transcription repressor HrcA [Ignavibacteria bacterium RBG_16_35_7]OGU85609.1 MAG: heat-inducible transcription repressor HrcA [Ignavibacteria bacterium RIFOXYA12_FULL_35_25]OGU96294.1 MAG: heat-inducible transcription repressor HrcA [Ignavibacteria bacterium RIFOXYB12_FULL_35_14]